MMAAVVALTAAGCGGSDTPVAPPLAQPNLAPTGGLLVNACVTGTNGLITCAVYTGTVTNSGPGCAINVRGVTKTYIVNTQTQIGSSEWTYGSRIKVGEQISYNGTLLVVPAPLNGGWVYVTTVTADATSCQ